MNNYIRLFIVAVLVLLLVPAHAPAEVSGLAWGPYITGTTTDATTVNWKTDVGTAGSVEYAPDVESFSDGSFETAPYTGNDTAIYHLFLEGLEPDTRYYYRVRTGDQTSRLYKFDTFPLNNEPITFIVYGDTQEPQDGQTQLERHKPVADAIAREEDPRFVLHTGDLVNDPADMQEWDRFFMSAGDVISNTTMYPVAGNHEYQPEKDSPYYRYYLDVFQAEGNYSFDCGGVHVTVLDSNPGADFYSQEDWLERDLSQQHPWSFVAFHHPVYTSSEKNFGGWSDLRDLWAPHFGDASVDAVFSGHVHAYERCEADGIPYIIAGTGGGGSYPLRKPGIPESQVQIEDTLGYVRVQVETEPATCIFDYVQVGRIVDGEFVICEHPLVMDRVVIRKTGEGSPDLRSGWEALFRTRDRGAFPGYYTTISDLAGYFWERGR
ncbi:MAG: hypothetical protein APR55_00995 [Methanolinea sp. SDB]|nr:MAG: hypothetical protein APR55_00995 [Methanolinea sp. SDB]